MNETIARIAGVAGLDEPTAAKAVGIILNFLQKEAPGDQITQLINQFPDGATLMAEANSGGIMAMMPGIMGLGSQLMTAGLSMGQIQVVGKELFAIGREQVGDEPMGHILNAVPGLSQFV